MARLMEDAESLRSVMRWSNHECMDDLVIGPETELQSTPIVHYGEAPRAAASFNHARSERPLRRPFERRGSS